MLGGIGPWDEVISGDGIFSLYFSLHLVEVGSSPHHPIVLPFPLMFTFPSSTFYQSNASHQFGSAFVLSTQGLAILSVLFSPKMIGY